MTLRPLYPDAVTTLRGEYGRRHTSRLIRTANLNFFSTLRARSVYANDDDGGGVVRAHVCVGLRARAPATRTSVRDRPRGMFVNNKIVSHVAFVRVN